MHVASPKRLVCADRCKQYFLTLKKTGHLRRLHYLKKKNRPKNATLLQSLNVVKPALYLNKCFWSGLFIVALLGMVASSRLVIRLRVYPVDNFWLRCTLWQTFKRNGNHGRKTAYLYNVYQQRFLSVKNLHREEFARYICMHPPNALASSFYPL